MVNKPGPKQPQYPKEPILATFNSNERGHHQAAKDDLEKELGVGIAWHRYFNWAQFGTLELDKYVGKDESHESGTFEVTT